jgi:exo-beta-1,3-glucanase (GH17 family)
MRLGAVFFALAAAAIVAAWGWLGAAVEMPASPLGPGEKIQCVSYAPFRGDQDPFGPDIPIDPRQIEEDLVRLKPLTDCIRTYSVDHGLDQIPEIAGRHGMKVMLGLWLSSLPDLSRHQVEIAVALAQRFPDVIQAIVVGNEVLLRGEMSATDLANTIRSVKAQVTMPVTYADVWEFWLRYRDIASAVDFITIHVLPYWEDFPIPVAGAAAHVGAIRSEVAAAFPNREILIGEFGWPSAGRMREGALPSRANQARVVQEVLAQAKRDNYRVNVIEAFDQPWKRQLEGTVGGHWGLYDAYDRQAKFSWGAAVSNHPDWRSRPCSRRRWRRAEEPPPQCRPASGSPSPRWRSCPERSSAGRWRTYRSRASRAGIGCVPSPGQRSPCWPRWLALPPPHPGPRRRASLSCWGAMAPGRASRSRCCSEGS